MPAHLDHSVVACLRVQSPLPGPIGPQRFHRRECHTVTQRPQTGLERVATLRMRDGSMVTLEAILAPLPDATIDEVASSIAAMDPWRHYGIVSAQLTSYLAPGPVGQPRYLLIENDTIAGLVTLKLGWMFGTYLNLLAVLPGHQRKGLGSAALQWLESFGKERQERNQFVVTSAFNAPGLALYQRHGFIAIADMPGLIDDTETEILLRKRLSPCKT